MGEVYRARDARLGRDVAIKVLPEAFASDAERMARFEREAKVLASLNHPCIAHIHGLEESGAVFAIVMELVEGPTLADRIAAGPLSPEEALPLARQIAEGVEYAHDRGIVHRDLKPANIKHTAEGVAKILDFGLARALGVGDGAESSPDLSRSPTLTIGSTQQGVILGTAAFMSPEQARGKPADRRADIWAFGCVLYEMLTGARAFEGESVSDTLASVIKEEPNWEALPPSTPPRVRLLLMRCLTKDPKKRLQAVGEARIALEEAIAHPELDAAQGEPGAAPAPARPLVLPWAVAAAGLLAAALAFWAPWKPAHHAASRRLSIELGADVSLATGAGPAAVLSPDGSLLAFVARKSASDPRQLFVRRLDQLQAAVLAGTEGARNQFFSPDGQWIAFFADGKLKKVSAVGGAVVTLCDASNDRGGSWGEDGTIVFAPDSRVGLSRVSSAGGSPEPLTKLDEKERDITHRWPQVLPGGKAVLYTAHKSGDNFDEASIVVQQLPSGARKVVLRGGSQARYLKSGHIVFIHDGTLFAAPFNLSRLETAGPSAPALEHVLVEPGNGGGQYSFADDGTLAYLSGTGTRNDVSIFWMDRDGKTQPLRAVPASYTYPQFSPDGSRLALSISDRKQSDIWVYEWARDTLSRLTFDPASDLNPVWTPDGRRIAFSSDRAAGHRNIFWKRSDGTGEDQALTEGQNPQYPASWHPNGKFLAFHEQNPKTNWDILILPMEGDEASGWKPGKPTVFLNSPFVEVLPAFSPDGRWLAYMSNESGKFEIYVRPYPGPGGKWQVSTGGGAFPTWSRASKELFYESSQQIMVAGYTATGDAFHAEKPRLWSEGRLTDLGPNRNFDLSPDGKRFAVLKASQGEVAVKQDKVVLVTGFFDELRRPK